MPTALFCTVCPGKVFPVATFCPPLNREENVLPSLFIACDNFVTAQVFGFVAPPDGLADPPPLPPPLGPPVEDLLLAPAFGG